MKRSASPKETTKALPSATGGLIGLYGNTLQGWAYDSNTPELRLIVEIYLDNAFVTTVRADREQSLDAEGDGFHGFWAQLPAAFVKHARKVSARIANQGPWLAGSIDLPQTPVNHETQPAHSHIYYPGGLSLTGWAFDPAHPNKELVIRARIADEIVCTAKADKPHPALVYTKDADHGFELDLPWELADGQPHEVHIETEDGKALIGSPIMLHYRPEGITALLRQHWSGASTDDPTRSLVLALTEKQNRRFPTSCGFQHYPLWFQAFQQAQPLSPTPGKVCVLLLGNGTEADQQRSLHSISLQRLSPAQIEVVLVQDQSLVSTISAHLTDTTLFVPLQLGDRLAPHALDTLLQHITAEQAAWGYADCDQDTSDGERTNPWFKPVWDETLFQSMDYVTPGSAFTSHVMQQALSNVSPQANWPDILSALSQQRPGKVLHIPQVLYHRHPESNPNPDTRTPIWPEPNKLPSVSLIIPTRDQLHHLKPCIEGLLNETDYPALEVIVVNNESHEPETLAYLSDIQSRGVRVLDYPKAFNYAAINNWAVAQARGEIIGLINNDVKVIEPRWLKNMVTQLMRPNIGAVGAKLLWPNGMVQHAGVVVGIIQLAAHTGNKLYKDDLGYMGFNQVPREQSAVTAACLLLRKSDFESLGGFDADHYPVAFNDVDLCLRLRAAGKKIVWTPDAVLIHAESASRGKEDTPAKANRAQREQNHFIRQWADQLNVDPYYHPALSHDYANGPYGALACPPHPMTARS